MVYSWPRPKNYRLYNDWKNLTNAVLQAFISRYRRANTAREPGARAQGQLSRVEKYAFFCYAEGEDEFKRLREENDCFNYGRFTHRENGAGAKITGAVTVPLPFN